MLGTLLGSIFGALFDALAKGINAWLKGQQERADQIELGQQREVSAAAVNALDVMKRMDAARASTARDVASVTARLNDGAF